ncbi:MAG: undecaprenyl/decaprenyl-phosphate alpha-N-acetylglucosaminyl 1-phosphate transferase [Candidatus Omnitrophica bacterium]|nr:undecaprenyl/decaprenyl-phosphate alpha-N-acetylglucosaminyl 1-phosphate transferase [Candidatus Omnitrophota bacterium]
MRGFLISLLVFVITAIFTFIIKTVAPVFGIVDKPSERKVHKKPIPLLGGLAIYIGFMFGLLFYPQTYKSFFPLLLGGTIILILGIIDDAKGLSARIRFVVQVIAALVLITGGIRISFLTPGLLGFIGEVLITLLWVVGLTNAFNYLDGLNGLAAGSAIINAFFFSVVLYITGQDSLAVLSYFLLMGSFGFLPFNFKKAQIFLGDTGSTFLGFMLAGIAIAGDWAGDHIVKIAIPIIILGVPIFDMTFTTVMRIKEGKVKSLIEWLRYAGKDHFHHYLVYLGLKPIAAVVFIWTITFFLGLTGVMLGNDKAWEGILTVFQASIFFAIIAVLIVIGRSRSSGWDKSDQ